MPSGCRKLAVTFMFVLVSGWPAGAQVRPQVSEKPKKAARATQIVVTTSPDAEVYLDDTLKGQASPQGRLVVEKPKPGERGLRVSLAGKKDYEPQETVVAGQVAEIEAVLVDFTGSIRVQTSRGAEAFLHTSSRPAADAAGQPVLHVAAPASHQLRVREQGKRESRQSATLVAGRETTVESRLQSVGPSPGQARDNAKDGLKYVWVPPGTFMMGCSPGDSECYGGEKPSHQVTITRGFWISQTPVTASAYERFVRATGRGWNLAIYSGRGHEDWPIANVRWDDALAYCGWIGGRLPTEAEWEYAARGRSTEARYGNLDEIAWSNQNSGGQMHAVAQKRPNGFGLYDMLGNVWEWVSDWYGQHYYRSSKAQDPQGPPSGKFRVLRGSSWYAAPWNVRVSMRFRVNPTAWVIDAGFRCVCEVGSP
jgi:formylglycine-generating enzyme required for sulfatase activity